jgi:hypothetical protein
MLSIALLGEDSTNDKLALLALETPIQVTQPGRRVKKSAVERIHLERYRSDYLNGTGKLPFDAVTVGGDPPDFIVETEAGPESLDCTTFCLSDRRLAFDLFEHLKKRLADESSASRFDNLKDCLLLIWFGWGNELPPKRTGRSAVEQLIQLLRQCIVDHARLASSANEFARQGLPQTMSPGDVAIFWTPDKTIGFQAVPAGSNSGDPFFDLTGFSCRLQTSTEVRQSEVHRELRKLISDHEKSEQTEHLLITVGGPDAKGVRYPSEEFIVQLMTDEMFAFAGLTHIRRISLHVWSTGTICEFRPKT